MLHAYVLTCTRHAYTTSKGQARARVSFAAETTNIERLAASGSGSGKRRREEGIPILLNKFKENLNTVFAKDKADEIYAKLSNPEALDNMSVIEFQDLLKQEHNTF